MTGTPDLKIKLIRVRPSHCPQYFTLNLKLPHDLPRLVQVALYPGCEGGDFPHVIRFFAIVPGFRKLPGRMVQEQTTEGEQPHEEEQKEASIKMQLAIPKLTANPESRGFMRWFSG